MISKYFLQKGNSQWYFFCKSTLYLLKSITMNSVGYLRKASLGIIIIIVILFVDFYSGLEIKKTISFDNFNCKTEQSSYRGRGSSTSCFLITSDGTKYFLPNNVNFGDNLKKEDKLLVIKTFFLNQNKRFEIKYKNYVETADISFFQSKLNVTILIISLVLAVLFSCFSDNIIFGNLFVFCLVIDCFLILMYFLNF